jgi:hypothetical protein
MDNAARAEDLAKLLVIGLLPDWILRDDDLRRRMAATIDGFLAHPTNVSTLAEAIRACDATEACEAIAVSPVSQVLSSPGAHALVKKAEAVVIHMLGHPTSAGAFAVAIDHLYVEIASDFGVFEKRFGRRLTDGNEECPYWRTYHLPVASEASSSDAAADER